MPLLLLTPVNLIRFRLRAAAYGLRLRTTHSGWEVVRFSLVVVGVLLSAIGFVVANTRFRPVPTPTAIAVVAALVMLAAVLTFRAMGRLAGIMDVAARNDDLATQIRADMATGMRNGLAYDQLIAVYEPVLVAVNETLPPSRRFEWVTAGATSTQRYAAIAMTAEDPDSLETILCRPIVESTNERFQHLAEPRQRLMRKWREIDGSNRRIGDEEGDNYCLAQLHVGDRIEFDVGVATYGEIVRSCDALINEFALFAFLTGPNGSRSGRGRRALRLTPAATLRCLPWRNRSHREAGARPRDLRRSRRGGRPSTAASLFLRPRDRAAGLGVAVVTLDVHDDSRLACLGKRSDLVGTYPSTRHVVPAGMCNTNGTDVGARGEKHPPPPTFLRRTMQCEFLEEWFEAQELESNKKREWERRVEVTWEERVLPDAAGGVGLLKEDLELTGFAFDLLNLRPEVCATAAVDTSSGELNWEFHETGGEVSLEALEGLRPTEVVQSGAAALWLASRARPRRLKQRVLDEGEVEDE